MITSPIRHRLALFGGLALFLTLLTGGCSSGSGPASDGGSTLTIELRFSGDNQVPPVSSDASASGSLSVDRDSGALSGTLSVSGVTLTAAHIHRGAAGISGGVVVGLAQSGSDPDDWQVPSGSQLSADELAELLAGTLYVNLHSAAHPTGELRAQIVPDGIRVMRAEMVGEQQLPPVASGGSAVGYVTVDDASRAITANLRHSGISDASAAHIHSGVAGTSGGIVLGLTLNGTDAELWESATGSTLTAEQFDELLAGGLYFNLHTVTNPAGELRGQILPANVTLIRAALDGEHQVPPVTTGASAIGYLTVDRDSGALVAKVRNSGLADASAAHVHSGFAGTNGGIAVGLSGNAGDADLWESAAGASLTTEQLAELLAGGLYFNMHSTSNPAGELRGQLVPEGISLVRTLLSGDAQVPPVTSSASAVAYTTVDTASGDVVGNIRSSGLADATAAHIHQAAVDSNGPVAIPLVQDAIDPAFWATAEGSQLSPDQFIEFGNGGLYYNLHSSTHPAGELRGQIVP